MAASALILAAIGAAGTGGIATVLAVDPATVPVIGELVDGADTPLPGVHLVITEELPPDGGFAGFQATTAADGTFHVDLYPWGTFDAPATVTIKAPPDEEVTLVVDDQCSRTVGVTVSDRRQLALADPAAAKPLDVVATTTLLGEVCGTTATPPPNTGGGGGRNVTPPPTDSVRLRTTVSEERLGPALTIGFALGLVGAIVMLTPRTGARRRE